MQIIVPGAAKADIWRLAIIWQYGGIYVDSDVKAGPSAPRLSHSTLPPGHGLYGYTSQLSLSASLFERKP